MSNISFLILRRFIFFLIVQVFIFNNFNLFGTYDPYICLVFILTFPIKIDKTTFLIISFIFGFVLDLFTDSLGLNAAACLTVAYLRSYIMSFIFGAFFDPIGLKLIKNYVSESSFFQKFLYITSIIILYHFLFFSLEAFSFKFFYLIIYKTLITSILSIIFCYTSILIMVENEK